MPYGGDTRGVKKHVWPTGQGDRKHVGRSGGRPHFWARLWQKNRRRAIARALGRQRSRLMWPAEIALERPLEQPLERP